MAAPHPPTVLICEDDPNLRELMRASLGEDYRFVDAASVAEAQDALRLADPAVVLVDLLLPGGSGLDIIRAVRGRPERADAPVVVVSAWTTDDYRAAAEDAGADAFVAKPFPPESLAALVADLLRSRT